MTLAHERTSQFFEGVRRKRREIITPEGVPITVELADYGERLSAFFLDFLLQPQSRACDRSAPRGHCLG